jgi:type IV pilus assembly protein PilE
MRNNICYETSDHSFYVSGFTLIELMITVAIVGVLAAIAYPSYQIYILKSRRADAMAALSQAQTSIERCYAANFSYQIPNVCPAPPSTSPKGYYTITAVSTGTTYTLTATVAGSQIADKTCSQMMIDQTNAMTAVDNANNPQSICWTR